MRFAVNAKEMTDEELGKRLRAATAQLRRLGEQGDQSGWREYYQYSWKVLDEEAGRRLEKCATTLGFQILESDIL